MTTPNQTTIRDGILQLADTSQLELLVIRHVANIAHHGGLLGIKSDSDAMDEIRKLTIPYWDKEQCSKLQKSAV